MFCSHGNVHIYGQFFRTIYYSLTFLVGGDFLDQSTSANDPIFYIHHSFVDMIWEIWRQNAQVFWLLMNHLNFD